MFVNVVVPVVLIMAGGWLFGRYTRVELKPLSQFAMYVLSPALIFSYLARSEIPSAEFAQIVLVTVLFTAAASLLTWLVARICGLREAVSPLLLVSVFTNSGNYGLPVLLFAYGREGFTRGVAVVVIHFMLMYTLGIYYASLQEANWRRALANVVRLPSAYATAAAMLVRILGLPLPDFLYNPLRLVGDATVPVVLLVLGMQLARTRVEGALPPVVVGSVLRLVVGPLAALGLVWGLGVTGLTAKVLVLQHAMPTAVLMTLVAIQYGARPDLVANVTFVTTVCSLASVTALLYGLQRLF